MKKFTKGNLKELSVILPVHNEENNIRRVLNSILDFFNDVRIKFEIIVIDDGSYDGTSEIIDYFESRYSQISSYRCMKNEGYGAALTKGIYISKFSWILFIDADGQYKIQDITKLIPCIDKYDCIIGRRKDRMDPFYRLLLGQTYNYIIQKLFHLEFKDINCGFKLFRKEIFDNVQVKCKGALFYGEILLKAKNNGWAIKEVEISHFPREKDVQKGAKLSVILKAFFEILGLYNDAKFNKFKK